MADRLESKVTPIFGDDVLVSMMVKKSRDGKKKDGLIRVCFLDSARKEIVADVVMSPLTAEAMGNILMGSIKKLDDIMAGKKVDFPKPPVKKQDETTYIG
ncbi:MAG TPA: hypothetical protein ENN60_01415 [archaeon]|nr:hypothetical protein [archaeon]